MISLLTSPFLAARFCLGVAAWLVLLPFAAVHIIRYGVPDLAE